MQCLRIQEVTSYVPGKCEEQSDEIICTNEEKSAQACTMEYAPVCGKSILNTGEIIYETYGNKCAACSAMKVISYRQGECQEQLGGDRDEHGCIPSAGYSWCEEKQKCIRQWEEDCNGGNVIGGQRDEYGCLGPAGYSWDEDIGACTRNWELDENQKIAAKTAVVP